LSTGFPIDKAAITEIFHSEYISTLDHLREEKTLFTPEYFQEQKIPKVLSKILSEEIQKLAQLEGSQQEPGPQDSKESQLNLTSARLPIPVPATAPAATLNASVPHATVITPPTDATSGTLVSSSADTAETNTSPSLHPVL
jgi:hypothetical protein